MRGYRLPAWAIGSIGGIALIALWWLLAVTVFVNPQNGFQSVPTPPQVVQSYIETGWDYYFGNFMLTLQEAGVGYLWGNALALLLSAFVLIVPRLEGAVMQIAIITYCVPIVAIGPLALLIIGAPKHGQPSGTAIFLAALSCFFTTVVSALLGLKAADRASLDVVHVYGGGTFTQLRKVRIVAALPNILNGLQIAVPAAFLGAVLGEFFGKVDVGVGPAMIVAQQSLRPPLLWGLALASGAVALAGYGLVGLLTRAVTPWSRGRAS